MTEELLTEPTFDKDGYPTEETLERIKTWPIDVMNDAHAAMEFVGQAWKWPDWGWEVDPDFRDPDFLDRPVRRYVFSTGGWSGNESLVNAIEANWMLQMLGAWSWRRGGHYEYRFPAEDPT